MPNIDFVQSTDTSERFFIKNIRIFSQKTEKITLLASVMMQPHKTARHSAKRRRGLN